MNNWSSGICDCFNDCNLCCYAWWCTPCLFGENAEKIDGSSCCGSGCLWYLLTQCGLCCFIHMYTRKALRQRFNIQEDCDDCVVTTFCATCAICQEARELKFRLPSSEGPVVTQPMGTDTYNSFEQLEMAKQGKY